MSEPGDEQLLAAWGAGDRVAGGALLDRYFALVCRFFANKLPDDAEDLVQQTFLACVEGRDRLRTGAFRSYLFGAAHNVLRAQLRRRLRTRSEDLDEIVLAELTPSPSTIIADRREQRMLLEALRRLPLHQQVALELYFWERLTATEIGDALELPEGTVRTRLRDGRLRLLKEIDRLRQEPRALPTTDADVDAWADDIAAMLASWEPPR